MAARGLGGTCVFASEIEKRLRTTYESNFGLRPAGDIREIEPRHIPKHDLLCAGFPCQPFSKAGDQRGLKDSIQGTVFLHVIEIVRHCLPMFVVLENVSHFVRHDKGNTYAKVKNALQQLGYEVRHAQLSPHRFGVPQIRERMYMVGRLGGLNGFQWPSPQTRGDDLSIRAVLDKNPMHALPLSTQVTNCLETWQEFLQRFPEDEQLPSFPIWSMEFGATYPYDRDSLFKVPVKILRGERGACGEGLNYRRRCDILQHVPSYARRERNAFPSWKQEFIRKNRTLYHRNRAWIKGWLSGIRVFPPSLQKLEWNCKGGRRDIWNYIIQFRASGVRVKRPTTAPSLVAMTTTQIPIVGWERRYMTVKECARLQSMDELEHFPSDTAAMAALGNAVNVKVARLVLEALLSVG